MNHRHQVRHKGWLENEKADLFGVLVVDKPAGISSNDAVQQAKRLFGAQKVGHTGSLDPLATGVLPLCFGEATKFSQFLLDADKKYWARIRLGVTTETGDADGEVISEADASGVTAAQVVEALKTFVGEIEQIPSMYSALKHQGQPLYKLARQGIEVERAPRKVTIYSAEMLNITGSEIELLVHCSKGTYIRSLAEDLGAALGCGGHVSGLRRLAAGPYQEEQAVSFEQLKAIGSPGRVGRAAAAGVQCGRYVAGDALARRHGALFASWPTGAGGSCSDQGVGADI